MINKKTVIFQNKITPNFYIPDKYNKDEKSKSNYFLIYANQYLLELKYFIQQEIIFNDFLFNNKKINKDTYQNFKETMLQITLILFYCKEILAGRLIIKNKSILFQYFKNLKILTKIIPFNSPFIRDKFILTLEILYLCEQYRFNLKNLKT